jgi:hypothetical protein
MDVMTGDFVTGDFVKEDLKDEHVKSVVDAQTIDPSLPEMERPQLAFEQTTEPSSPAGQSTIPAPDNKEAASEAGRFLTAPAETATVTATLPADSPTPPLCTSPGSNATSVASSPGRPQLSRSIPPPSRAPGVPSLADFARRAAIPRQCVAPESFRRMLLNEEPAPPRRPPQTPRHERVPFTLEEARAAAEGLMRGRHPIIPDAKGVADVIDELTRIQLQAMKDGAHRQVDEIQKIITDLRRSFRLKDREELRQTRMAELKARLASTEADLTAEQRHWRTEEEEHRRRAASEASAMDERHSIELADFENESRSERAERQYNRRSSGLLQLQTVEKKMLLMGDFRAADTLRRSNRRLEATEIAAKAERREAKFLAAREALLATHAKEIEELRAAQDFALKILHSKKAEAIEILQKRVAALRRIIEEDLEPENFVSRKFKKGPDFVLPLTVTVSGGEDIPPTGQSRFLLGDSISRFRESNAFGPLPLPALKVKKVKHPPKAVTAVRPKNAV